MKSSQKGSLMANRTLQVLLLFQDQKKLTLTEISRKLKISHTSAYRIVFSLASYGFLTRDENKNYMLSPLFLRFARMVETDLRNKALPILQELAKLTQESAYLSVSHHIDHYVFIEGVVSPLPLKWSVEIGGFDVSYAGSAGKVHLSLYDDEEIAEYFEKNPLTPFTSATKTAAELWEEIRRIRQNGYAISYGERIDGVIGISVPVRDFSGSSKSVVLSLFLPESRANEEKIISHIQALKQAAKQIAN